MSRSINNTPEVQALLDARAPVCCGISGGKDSHAVAWALSQELKDYEGPKILIHSDLGSVEWEDSHPACQRIADKIGWELITCSRRAGGMMHRWNARWASSIRRYIEMETVVVVLPWSTPAMRFCTSELKVGPITSALKKRFGRVPMINVTGVRGEESSARAKQPIVSVEKKLPPGSLNWRPIHHWLIQDVWDAIKDSGVTAHEAYSRFGSSRVSCRFCILANEADLRASLVDPAAQAIYTEMCDLELKSGFAFQGSRWLTSLGIDLIPDGAIRLENAKQLQTMRTEAQAWLPKHLQFTRGWPHCVPTEEETEKLATMRRKVGHLYGWDVKYTTGKEVRERYQKLMEIKAAKDKAKK